MNMCVKTLTAKRFLQRYHLLETEREAIEMDLCGLQGQKYEQTVKSTSRKNMDTRWNKKLTKLDVIEKQMDEIESCIDQVQDARSRTILRCKYLWGMNLDKTSTKMFYSYTHVKGHLHPLALRQFYDVLVKRGHVKEQSV